VLGTLAAEGQLDNLVIDEVHMVDAWGAYFRVDFQMLSGVRKTWLSAPGARLRTILLTATLTPQSRGDLSGLFPPQAGAGVWELVSQRLRPEMVYFDRRFTDEGERDRAVREALWRLPRPAILYVTERADAEQWHRKFTQEGFRRIGCFHGDTRPRRRRELLEQWRADDIDLMVATSAFGLGVDKPDVRAVVHACFPENMNRYYQEVGRGGRDGWTAVCLLLPTGRDEEVAFGLCPKLMTTDLLKKRWQAMWDADSRKPVPGADHVWLLDPASIRQGMLGQRTGRENVLWNKRLLLQLQRAGALELRGIRYEYPTEGDEPPRELIEAEIKINPTTTRVAEVVETPRKQELEAAEQGLRLVAEYLRCRRCIAKLLAGLYGEETQLVCGGCRWCRKHRVPHRDCPALEWEGIPRGEAPSVVTLVGECPNPFSEEDAFGQALRGCLERMHVRRFLTAEPYLTRVSDLLGRLYGILPKYLRTPYRLDSLDAGSVELLPREVGVVFHPGRPLEHAFRILGGREVAHWFRAPLTVADLRTPLAAHGVLDIAVRPRPEDWFRL
jgi:ATP-dependent DNA helicase RecQ